MKEVSGCTRRVGTITEYDAMVGFHGFAPSPTSCAGITQSYINKFLPLTQLRVSARRKHSPVSSDADNQLRKWCRHAR